MDKNNTLELTPAEMVQFLNYVRDDAIINVAFETEGGDTDAGREVQTESGKREA